MEIREFPRKTGLLLGSGEYTYEYETETSLKVECFTMDTPFGEVVAEPLAKQMFNQMVPGMLDQPMIQYAYGI